LLSFSDHLNALAQYLVSGLRQDQLSASGQYSHGWQAAQGHKSVLTSFPYPNVSPTAVGCREQPCFHLTDHLNALAEGLERGLRGDELSASGQYSHGWQAAQCHKTVATSFPYPNESPTAVGCRDQPCFHLTDQLNALAEYLMSGLR